MTERLWAWSRRLLLAIMLLSFVAGHVLDHAWGLWVNGVCLLCFAALELSRDESKVGASIEGV